MKPSIAPGQRERWSELLSLAPDQAVIGWADEVLATSVDCEVVRPAEVGSIVVEVREPIASQRFQLCDLIVTSASVQLAGEAGWGMRQGDCRQAALAQAICEAELVRSGPHAHIIDEGLRGFASAAESNRRDEWARLTPTIVEFEEVL